MPLHFRDEGEGPPVVLVHGLGASSRVFDPLFEKRGPRRLLAIDLPHTGKSRHWAASTPEAIGDALVRFLDSRRVERFHLFGHSFGGLVALHVAARSASRRALRGDHARPRGPAEGGPLRSGRAPRSGARRRPPLIPGTRRPRSGTTTV